MDSAVDAWTHASARRAYAPSHEGARSTPQLARDADGRVGSTGPDRAPRRRPTARGDAFPLLAREPLPAVLRERLANPGHSPPRPPGSTARHGGSCRRDL